MTTGPTLAQSAQVQAVVAQVAMSDTETTAVITHNLAISTAAPGGATAVHPVLLVDAGHDCAVDLIRVDIARTW